MPNRIYQFKIVPKGITPPIWRRIQVPESYSFWDLHVAIQYAMGWLDCHLHAFRIRRKHARAATVIGIPDDFGIVGDDEHEDMLEWLGGKYEPGEFALGKVRFDNPGKRWKIAFEEA